MGRSWSRFHAYHETRSEQTWDSRAGALKPEFEDVRYALCGSRMGQNQKTTSDTWDVDCPKCSAKLAKPLLEQLNPPLELLKMPTPAFRSCYAVHRLGDVLAYVVFEAGFGGSWNIRGLEFTTFPQVTFAKAYVRLPWGDKAVTGLNSNGYGSKEAAALAVPLMIDAGLIKSHSVMIREREGLVAAQRTKEETRRARRDAKNKRDEEVMEGLQSIYDRRDALRLTNFEIDALQTAIRYGVDTPLEGSDD